MELEIELPDGATTDFGIALSNSKGELYRVGFDAAKNEFYSDRTKAGEVGFPEKFAQKRHTAPRFSKEKNLRMHLFFDVASCELFADGGEVVMADIFFPTEDFTQLKLYANGGGVKLIKGTAYGIMRAVK